MVLLGPPFRVEKHIPNIYSRSWEAKIEMILSCMLFAAMPMKNKMEPENAHLEKHLQSTSLGSM